MHELKETLIDCPYCGEQITVFIDTSVEHQDYIEDCQVCCRPISIHVEVSIEGDVYVTATHENE